MSADRLIVALDVGELAAAERALEVLAPLVRFFKVGLELYAAAGPAAVERVRRRNARVFLDLKVCDIPNTARGAVAAAARLGPTYVTVHALGGAAMIAAAREAAETVGAGTKILAVTLLTSLGEDDLAAFGMAGPVESAVVRLGRVAVDAGAHGLVASPREVRALRDALGAEVVLVTPGVRPAGSAPGDQRRTLTPREALAAGATHVVVGRPILAAPDPVAAARSVLAELGA